MRPNPRPLNLNIVSLGFDVDYVIVLLAVFAAAYLRLQSRCRFQ